MINQEVIIRMKIKTDKHYFPFAIKDFSDKYAHRAAVAMNDLLNEEKLKVDVELYRPKIKTIRHKRKKK